MSENQGNEPNAWTENKPWWIDFRDALGLIGICLIGYGAWLVYEPLGFAVPGAVMTAIAVFGVRS